jgi:ribosomal protein L13
MAESEADSMVIKVDTGKFVAVCNAKGLPVTTDATMLFDVILEETNLFKRSFFMLASHIPASWIDAAIDRLMSRRPKK